MPKESEIGDPTRNVDLLEELLKAEQKITIRLEMRKFNKPTTIIEGIDPKDFKLEEIAKGLKMYCACGGTVKDGKILLQGDQRKRSKEYLKNNGFLSDSIMVI